MSQKLLNSSPQKPLKSFPNCTSPLQGSCTIITQQLLGTLAFSPLNI